MVAAEGMLEGLFMFSRRLQMMCVIASGSSGSAEDGPPPLAADVDGKLDASDCVRFANDVIAPPASYVIRNVQ